MAVTKTVEARQNSLGIIKGTAKITLTSGSYVRYLMDNSGPVTVRVWPGSGCTALIKSSTSHQSEISATPMTANFLNWLPGSVTAYAETVYDGPISGLEITATGGSLIAEVCL